MSRSMRRTRLENVRRYSKQSGARLNESVDAKGTSLGAVTHLGIMIFEVAAEPVAAFFACNEEEIVRCGWFKNGQNRRLTGICDGARWQTGVAIGGVGVRRVPQHRRQKLLSVLAAAWDRVSQNYTSIGSRWV